MTFNVREVVERHRRRELWRAKRDATMIARYGSVAAGLNRHWTVTQPERVMVDWFTDEHGNQCRIVTAK